MAEHRSIDIAILRQLLDYNPATGALTWRERPIEFFRDGLKTADRAMRTWNTRYAGRPAFTSVNNGGYYCGAVLRCGLLAQRVIWAIVTGEWPTEDIDHINGNKIDNRFENFRVVPRKINARNAKRYSHNSSGHNGVSWCEAAGKWRARLTVDDELIYLGVFDDILDAVAARKAAEAGHGFTERHGT